MIENQLDNLIKNLTNKDKFKLVKSGTKALSEAFKLAKTKGTKILLPDQGGWLSYQPDCELLGFETEEYKTNYGVLKNYEELFKENPNSLIVINSCPGYFAFQNMKQIELCAKRNNVFIINDASGSIGQNQAKYGDIIVFSCGKDKIVNNFYGGFICYNEEFENYFTNMDYKISEEKIEQLENQLENINNRIEKLLEIKSELISKIKSDEVLNECEILNADGVNLIVLVQKEKKEDMINHIERRYKEYQFTVCPRYIRILNDAISFEIKRIKTN